MNRRKYLLTTTLAMAATTFPPFALGAEDGKIGRIEAGEWAKINREAGEKLQAIKPDSTPLSDSDQSLLAEMAAGSLVQLTLSQVAALQAVRAEAKAYAEAEVEEQRGLAVKLKEIAGAKGVVLPEVTADELQEAADKMKAVDRLEFDAVYLGASGVDGHQQIEKTMQKVQTSARDAALKSLAETTLPLIRIHLQAARDEMKNTD